MTERAYRLVVGILLISFLFFQFHYAIWALLGMMLFEGLTNWRVPLLVSRALYPNHTIEISQANFQFYTINYDAERMLRWIVLFLIFLGIFSYTEELFWFFPWFVSLMLLLAGITGICPMVMALRKLGLK